MTTMAAVTPINAAEKAEKSHKPEKVPTGTFQELAISEIIAEGNIRTDLSLTDRDGANLLESIRNHGVIQPVTVIKGADGKYRLRAGFRRYTALEQLKGRSAMIPSMVFTVDEARAREMALIENTQRTGLNPIDEANAIKEYLEHTGADQQTAAQRLGFTAGSISQKLSLLTLPPGVQKDVKAQKLDFTSARHLTRLKEPKLVAEAVERIQEKKLNAAATDELVKDILRREKEREEAKAAAEKEKAKAEGKAAPAKKSTKGKAEDEEKVVTLVDQIKELSQKMKPKSETALRKLLIDYAEKVQNARKDETRKEYELVLHGISLAAGIEL
jgi:ParB family transcriptional regulator, chromosome partitioning protein